MEAIGQIGRTRREEGIIRSEEWDSIMEMDGIDPREVKCVWKMYKSQWWRTCPGIWVGLDVKDWNLRVDLPSKIIIWVEFNLGMDSGC
jgi:hypothetical protein